MMLCEYGCGKEAKFKLKNGKLCCEYSYNKCLISRKKNSESNKGRERSEDTIRKGLEARKKYRHSDATRKKIGIANLGKLKGKKQSSSHRNKRMKTLKKTTNTEEHKLKRSIISKTLWNKPEYREKVIKKLRNVCRGKKWKKEQSKRSLLMWQDKEYRNRVMIGLSILPNNKERMLLEILNKLFPNKYEFVGDFSLFINGKNPDFINIEDKNIIELFGTYWHSEEITGEPVEKHERKRIATFERSGYKVLIIWENELNNISSLKSKLINFNRKDF